MEDHIKIVCKEIAEMERNCCYDLCGEHYKNYTPKIGRAFKALISLFPKEMANAIKVAKDF